MAEQLELADYAERTCSVGRIAPAREPVVERVRKELKRVAGQHACLECGHVGDKSQFVKVRDAWACPSHNLVVERVLADWDLSLRISSDLWFDGVLGRGDAWESDLKG